MNRLPPGLTLAEMSAFCDVVVECATADSFPEIARTVLEAGKTLIVLSASGVLQTPEMWDLALRHGGRVRLASGTLPGLDMIRCAAEGNIKSVHLKANIIAGSLAHEPYILEQGFDFSEPPAEPVEVFRGSVSEAARAFPRHFNVAISLGLAGLGLDRTTIEVIADGGIPGNIIHAEVEAQEIGLTLISRNRPSDNTRTSRIVALNIIAILRSMVSPVVVGS